MKTLFIFGLIHHKKFKSMKNQLLCLLFIFACLVACKEKALKIDDAVKKEVPKTIKSDTQAEKTKTVPENINRDTLEISSDGPFIHKIKVGDIVTFYLMQFGSIGEEWEYSLDNKEVLVFSGSTYEDSNPSNTSIEKGGKSYVNLFLEAKKSGSCNLKISKIFRGKLKSELNYKITVE